MIGALALRGLARHPIRTALVILGIGVAAALLLDMVMLSGGMERSFERMLLSRGFQIRLSPKGTLPFDTEAHLAGASALVRDLKDDRTLAAVGPVVAAPVHVRTDSGLRTAVAYGIDPTAQGLYERLSGADLEPGDSSGMVISESVSRAFGLEVGDSVRVMGRLDPQVAAAPTELVVTVRGIVRFIYESRDQRSVALGFPAVQRLGRFVEADPASLVMIKVASGVNVDSVAAGLARRFPDVAVNSIGALVAQFRLRLVYFKQLSIILATISVVVGALLIGTILTITVSEREGEFAVLRAIGFQSPRVVLLVMLEGLTLGLAGALLGVVLGITTARYLDGILTSFPGLPAAISFFVPDARSMLTAGLAVVTLGIAVSLYPAWRAATAPIAATLRAAAE